MKSPKKPAAKKSKKPRSKPPQPPAEKPKRTGCLAAAVQVLAKAERAMGCKEMVEAMLAQGLWKTAGKTPAATLYAAVIREIAAKGDKSRFRKTDRGMFELAAENMGKHARR